MKRTTLVLVALFAGVLAYFLLVERKAKPADEAAREAKRLLSLEETSVRSFKITLPTGSVGAERAESGKWRMTDPLRARAVRWACDAVASALASMERVRAVSNEKGAAGLAEMGLAQPRARVEFTLGSEDDAKRGAGASGPTTADAPPSEAAGGPASSAPPQVASSGTASPGATPSPPSAILEIGGEVPATSSVFLRILGKDEIYLVPSSSTTTFLKPVQEYRDRALLDTTVLDVGEARISRAEGDLRLKRRDEDWWIEAPIEDLAEGSKVQSLLSTVVTLRADSFIDGGTPVPASSPAPAAMGLDPPKTAVRFMSRTGTEIATVKLGSPVPGENDKCYARVEEPGGGGTVAVVSSLGLSSMSEPAAEFRSRKALPFHPWEATGVDLVAPGATLSFVKKDGVWSATSPASLKVDPGAVDETLRAVSEIAIDSYDAARGTSASSLGLDPPKTRIEVRFGEGSGKTKTLVLGAKAGTKETLYARASDRPGVFTVSASILDRLTGGPTLYAEKPPVAGPAPAAAKGENTETGGNGEKGAEKPAAPGAGTH